MKKRQYVLIFLEIRICFNILNSIQYNQLSLLMNIYADKSLATFFQNEYEVWVKRPRALFSSWYELYPVQRVRFRASMVHLKMWKCFSLKFLKWVLM